MFYGPGFLDRQFPAGERPEQGLGFCRVSGEQVGLTVPIHEMEADTGKAGPFIPPNPAAKRLPVSPLAREGPTHSRSSSERLRFRGAGLVERRGRGGRFGVPRNCADNPSRKAVMSRSSRRRPAACLHASKKAGRLSCSALLRCCHNKATFQSADWYAALRSPNFSTLMKN